MSHKTINIIFWITTSFIVIFDGIIPLLTFQTDLAKEGIRHLGYPDYFGVMLVVFRLLGVIVLIFPQIPVRIKEWAYAGFAIEFLSASVSNTITDGFGVYSILPIITLCILLTSYFSFHKKQNFKSI